MARAEQAQLWLVQPQQQLMLPFQLAAVAAAGLIPQTLIAQVALVALLELPQV
jgi:hypothetical protein